MTPSAKNGAGCIVCVVSYAVGYNWCRLHRVRSVVSLLAVVIVVALMKNAQMFDTAMTFVYAQQRARP